MRRTSEADRQGGHLGPAAEGQQTHRRNNKSKRLDKSGLYPPKSGINMKNVNVCSGGGKRQKDVLKYTFIQSLREIKQQN